MLLTISVAVLNSVPCLIDHYRTQIPWILQLRCLKSRLPEEREFPEEKPGCLDYSKESVSAMIDPVRRGSPYSPSKVFMYTADDNAEWSYGQRKC